MTTIAWDGKTLAGDRQAGTGGTPSRTRKVHRFQHADGRILLFGSSGRLDDCEAYRRWAMGLSEKPKGFGGDLSVISIDERYRIWVAHEQMHWYEIGHSVWAIGSGCDYALGAMLAGKSAAEAVRIASCLDVHTGMGVDTVRFR